MTRKKVLLITQNFYPEIGSAGNRIKNIYQLLKREGYEVTVLTTEASYPNKKIYRDQKFWNDDSLNHDKNIHRVNVANRKYSLNMFSRLLYYIEFTFKMILFVLFDRNKYGTVFVSSPPIFIGLVGVIAKYKYKVKLILDIRDLWPESLKGVGVFNYRPILWMFSFFERFLYNSANYIVVNSVGFIESVYGKSKIQKENITFLPNSARMEELLLKSKKDPNEFKVIYTGNLGLAQDIDFLKELSVQLNHHKVRLNIIGYGMRRMELVEFIKENALSYVSFIKPTTREDCLKINVQHDIGLISLQDKEVFDTVLPGKIIDYMISGLPIVASVSGYSKYIIEKYRTGFVSETRDIDEIIRYILYLKNNKEVRREMGKKSKNVIKSKFLWEDNIHTLISLIEEEQFVAGDKIYDAQFENGKGKNYG